MLGIKYAQRLWKLMKLRNKDPPVPCEPGGFLSDQAFDGTFGGNWGLKDLGMVFHPGGGW